jgi:carbonic anhydrase
MCTRNHAHTPACFSRHEYLTAYGGGAAKPTRSDLTPKDALAFLYAGNKRFAAGKPEAPNRDLERLREVALAQRPFAVFLGCSDSRVPIEIIFDQGFGDLFVARIAGNVTTPECLGSLEFGTHILGANVLYVLGHTNCGAVAAAMKAEPVPGQISALFQHLRPAVKAAKGDAAAAVQENVRIQAALLSASPVIAKSIRDGRLLVAGGVYDIATGKVTPVEM